MPNVKGGPEPSSLTIACGDGALLAGKLFKPENKPRTAIVIHGATAVPCRYYESFARWLSSARQAAVLIYDYRDYGSSARGHLRRARATMAVWGIKDQDAALGFLCKRYPDLPVEVIGHSMGGMFLAFHKNAARVCPAHCGRKRPCALVPPSSAVHARPSSPSGSLPALH